MIHSRVTKQKATCRYIGISDLMHQQADFKEQNKNIKKNPKTVDHF